MHQNPLSPRREVAAFEETLSSDLPPAATREHNEVEVGCRLTSSTARA